MLHRNSKWLLMDGQYSHIDCLWYRTHNIILYLNSIRKINMISMAARETQYSFFRVETTNQSQNISENLLVNEVTEFYQNEPTEARMLFSFAYSSTLAQVTWLDGFIMNSQRNRTVWGSLSTQPTNQSCFGRSQLLTALTWRWLDRLYYILLVVYLCFVTVRK